jgi:hypothetical protein
MHQPVERASPPSSLLSRGVANMLLPTVKPPEVIEETETAVV